MRRRVPLTFVAVFLALRATAASLTPYLVKDLDRGTVTAASTPDARARAAAGDLVFIQVAGPEAGVWRTDGTAIGTHRLYDGLSDHFNGMPMAITPHNGVAYFPIHTQEPDYGGYLFASDGTTPGTGFFTKVERWYGAARCGDGKLCFSGKYSTIGATDGTAAGTSIVAQTSASPQVAWAFEITALGDRAFFNTYDDVYGRCVGMDNFERQLCGELWVSDGTREGTHLFTDLNPGPYPSGAYEFFASTRGHLYFRGLGDSTFWSCQVWATDGTPEGTRVLTPTERFTCNRLEHSFAEANGHVYFVNAFGRIWESDGTPETTTSLWHRLGWNDSRRAYRLSTVNGVLLFQIADELWSYDGSSAVRIAKAARIDVLGSLGGRTYFSMPGHEVWSTDGTPEGTRFHVRVTAGGTLSAYAETPRKLFFRSGDDELFVTDGTERGTRRIEFNTVYGRGSSPLDLVAFGNRVFFTTQQPLRHHVSDGTAEGTAGFADASSREPMFLRDGHLYFRRTGDGGGLFITDGTAQGTKRVEEWLGVRTRVLEPPALIGNSVIFSTVEDANEVALMRRDADGAITRLEPGRWFTDFVAFGDRVFFWSLETSGDGYSLMITNGASGGTTRLASSAEKAAVMPFAKGAIFGARAESFGALSLWITDGTPEGTRALKSLPADPFSQIVPVRAWRDLAIFAVGRQSVLDYEGEKLWRTDGTSDGTYQLTQQKFMYAVPTGDVLTLVRKTATDTNVGWEIWTTDGTVAGTRLKSSGPGVLLSEPFSLPNGQPAIVYKPGRELHVRELTTNAVTIISTGALEIGEAAYANGRIYFNGCRGLIGCELWAAALDGTSRGEPVSVRVDYRGNGRGVTGEVAIFRVSVQTTGGHGFAVVTASTADGTLVAGRDYVPFTKEIFFEGDRDVTLTVPLISQNSGTMSVVLSAPLEATIAKGIATAHSDVGRRHAVRH